MALYGEGRGGSVVEGDEERAAARPRRPFPSSCIRPVSSTRLGRTTQRSAAMRSTRHDWIRPIQERRGQQHNETRRDGMEMGREQPSFFGSLAWALARQSNLVRLACQRGKRRPGLWPACQPGPVALRLTAAVAPSRAPKRCSAAQPWIDSCEDVNR